MRSDQRTGIPHRHLRENLRQVAIGFQPLHINRQRADQV
jgi:hypothetical protein